MNVAVIGANGFIGSSLMDQMDMKEEMTAIPFDLRPPDDEDRAWNMLDILNYDAVERALNGADAVVHLAGSVLGLAKKDPRSLVELEMIGTSNVLEVAAKKGLSKVILASSFYVYDYLPPEDEVDEETAIPMQHSDLFSAGKLMVEAMARHWGKIHDLNWVAIRIGSAYGPGKRCSNVVRPMLESALVGKKWLVWGTGSRKNQYTFVRDIADGMILALEHDVSGIFNLISPESVQIKDMVEIMSERFGLYCDFDTNKPEPRSSPYMSCKKAELTLGWEPTVLERGLAITFEEMKETESEAA